MRPLILAGWSLLLPGAVLLAGCGSLDSCENKVLSRSSSPDGHKEAVVFLRDCGFATSVSTNVSVIPQGAAFLSSPTDTASTQNGNALIVSGGDWTAASTVDAQWAGAERLTVTHDRQAKVFLSEASVNGVAIELRVRPPK